MDNNVYGNSPEDSVFSQVREGMVVIDRENNRVGKVTDIRFGEVDDTALDRGRGPASVEADDSTDTPAVLPDFAVGFGARPQEGSESDLILKQMQRSGYITIGATGLFSKDRFALPEHIQAIRDDEVHLSITKEELVERR
jgi:hypothetical protein